MKKILILFFLIPGATLALSGLDQVPQEPSTKGHFELLPWASVDEDLKGYTKNIFYAQFAGIGTFFWLLCGILGLGDEKLALQERFGLSSFFFISSLFPAYLTYRAVIKTVRHGKAIQERMRQIEQN